MIGVEHTGQVVKLKAASLSLAGESQRDLPDRRDRDLRFGIENFAQWKCVGLNHRPLKDAKAVE